MFGLPLFTVVVLLAVERPIPAESGSEGQHQ